MHCAKVVDWNQNSGPESEKRREDHANVKQYDCPNLVLLLLIQEVVDVIGGQNEYQNTAQKSYELAEVKRKLLCLSKFCLILCIFLKKWQRIYFIRKKHLLYPISII